MDRPSRWRCPACGVHLEKAAPANPTEQRLRCPDCGGQFRVRRRDGETPGATISGEVPAARKRDSSPVVGGLGLTLRGLALWSIERAFHVGNLVGGLVLLSLGGIFPVLGGWLRDEIDDWAGVLRALGGIPVTIPTADPDADLGPALGRSDAPELFADVARIAARLGARSPQQIRLTYLPCCGVVAWRRSQALILGLPLLDVLNRIELEAILAHELAHLAWGDATRSARSSRFVLGLGAAIDESEHDSWSPLRYWASFCRKWADRWLAPIALGQEVRADRASASIVGGDIAASALVKVAAVQPLFREVLEHYDAEDLDAPNLYVFFRVFWSRLPDTLQTSIRHRLLQDGEIAADPAHPPLLDRLAVVQSYPPRPFREPDLASASTLLGDRESLEQMLHNRLFFQIPAVEPSVFHRAGT